MGYPKRTIVDSALLRGTKNGQLPESILVDTPGQAGGVTVRLIMPAARGWRALCAEAKKNGHILKATSLNDSYRSLAIQTAVFKDRYTTTVLKGRPYRTWNGKRWYQRPNTAVAAVPGTSNHGKAAAIDTGEERDSDLAAEPLDNPTLNWLLANEQRFGFFHSVDSEPWHIDWFPGDVIPQAVLDFERGGDSNGDDDMPEIWLRGENGEITIMSAANNCRPIKDMAGLTKNLNARGIKGLPTWVPVAQKDVIGGVYGDLVGVPAKPLKLDDAQLDAFIEKLEALFENRTAEAVAAMTDKALNAHFVDIK